MRHLSSLHLARRRAHPRPPACRSSSPPLSPSLPHRIACRAALPLSETTRTKEGGSAPVAHRAHHPVRWVFRQSDVTQGPSPAHPQIQAKICKNTTLDKRQLQQHKFLMKKRGRRLNATRKLVLSGGREMKLADAAAIAAAAEARWESAWMDFTRRGTERARRHSSSAVRSLARWLSRQARMPHAAAAAPHPPCQPWWPWPAAAAHRDGQNDGQHVEFGFLHFAQFFHGQEGISCNRGKYGSSALHIFSPFSSRQPVPPWVMRQQNTMHHRMRFE